jgi:hypothetical protein
MFKFLGRALVLPASAALVCTMTMGDAQAGLFYWNGGAATDTTTWAGLGSDQTHLGPTFSATSLGGNSVSGSFAGSGGTVALVGTSWPSAQGFTAGDSLVWTLDNTNNSAPNTGPLTLTLGNAVLAGGLYLEADGNPGGFTAQVQALNGATSLGTESLSSDAVGDPVFIGAQDTTADITKLVFTMTSCSGQNCNVNDFAVDTLSTISATVAVPAPPIDRGLPVLLMAAGVLLAAGLLERSRKSSGLG